MPNLKTKSCLYCNGFFKPKKTNAQKYCSKKCATRAESKLTSIRKKQKSEYTHIGSVIKCFQCGKSFLKMVGVQKYCSKRCLLRFHNRKRQYDFCNCGNKKFILAKKCINCCQYGVINRLSLKEVEKLIFRNSFSISSSGYLKTTYKNKSYSKHQLIFRMQNKCTIKSGMVINHKNHDKLDNRPENLEEITRQENTIKSIEFHNRQKGQRLLW